MASERKTDNSERFVLSNLVYAGRRTINGSQLVCQLHLIQGDVLEEPRLFLPELFQGKVIGGIYSGASFTSDRASGLERISYAGLWHDRAIIPDWIAQDEAAEVAYRRVEDEADAQRAHAIDELLRPLRQLYCAHQSRGDFAGQEALEAAVLRSLRRPIKSK